MIWNSLFSYNFASLNSPCLFDKESSVSHTSCHKKRQDMLAQIQTLASRQKNICVARKYLFFVASFVGWQHLGQAAKQYFIQLSHF